MLSACLAQGQVEAASAGQRVPAFLERRHAVIAQPRPPAPHDDVAMRKRHAHGPVGPPGARMSLHQDRNERDYGAPCASFMNDTGSCGQQRPLCGSMGS